PVITVEAPAVTVEPPKVEVETPVITVEAPAVTVEPPKVEVEAPAVTVEAPAVAATVPRSASVAKSRRSRVKVEAPAAAAIASGVETAAPGPVAPQDELAALRAQLTALEARLAQLESAVVSAPPPTRLSARAEMPQPQVEPTESAAAPVEAGVGFKLPGAEEAARIAAEMAALTPPRKQTTPSTAPAAAAPTEPSRQPVPAAAPAAAHAPAAGREDDLEAIVGIGPTYARRLRQLGITTYEALAEASDDIMRQVAGSLVNRVEREDWRGQARRLSQRR
ncbi:MAG: hypothetical protein ACUVSS_11495, partial [Anaerolineae bacterium]